MMVEIGVDRIHHAFWRYLDPTHPQYEPDIATRDVIRSYYQYLDDEIGELLERFDDDTAVLVVSDHGAQAMDGAICVNEWLVQEGYLVLRETRPAITPFARLDGRLEPDAGVGRGRLLLPALPQRRGSRAGGRSSGVRVRAVAGRADRAPGGAPRPGWPDRHARHRPRTCGASAAASRPTWSSTSAISRGAATAASATGSNYTFENDTGPDDANHSPYGLCIVSGPGIPAERRDDLVIYDVAPTILGLPDFPAADGMRGSALGAQRCASSTKDQG